MNRQTVNRALDDLHMDNIDHALGRPVDVMNSDIRNSFVVEPDHADAAHMRASEFWKEAGRSGRYAIFQVTEQGREALVNYLAQQMAA